MTNRILFRHKDGSIYLSIQNKLVILPPDISRFQLSQALKYLPKNQREQVTKHYARLRTQEALLD